MGERGHPLNTFWELFFRAPTAATWSLVTPAGVADNGGLTVSVTSAGSALVGFEPSQRLRYSPAAISHDDGAAWDPALVPVSLAPVPDALALGSSGSGTALALVRRGSGELLTSGGPLLQWRSLPGISVAGRGPARCDPSGLDAVALNSSDDAMVGTGCRRAGSHWHLLPGWWALAAGWPIRWTGRWPRPTPRYCGSTLRALRRRRWSPKKTTIRRASSDSGAPPPAPGPRRSRSRSERSTTVLASAVGASGQQLVLLKRGGSSDLLEETAGPDRPWVELPVPPAGTVTVSPLADGDTRRVQRGRVSSARVHVDPARWQVGALPAHECAHRLRFFMMPLASLMHPGRVHDAGAPARTAGATVATP